MNQRPAKEPIMFRLILNPGIPLLVIAALLTLVPAGAVAQQRVALPRKAEQGTKAVTPATKRDPVRLRALLLSIHGFSRASLEAASADAPALLRQFIGNRSESITVHRQAIKALRFYPSQDNLAFIQAQLSLATPGLKRLYATSLGRYSGALKIRASGSLAELVQDEDVGVRHAAIGAARILGINADIRGALGKRLEVEIDPSVRRALNAALGD